MSPSYAITRPAAALWWAVLWRTIVATLMLIIPIFAVLFIIYMALAFGMIAIGLKPEAIAIVGEVVSFCINNIFLPMGMCGFVFWRLFKKGRFGSYLINAVREGKQVTTLKQSLAFAFHYYVEVIKYVWPLFFAGILIGVGIVTGHFKTGHISPLFALAGAGLCVYLHLLVLTDLIRRGSFAKYQFVVTKINA